MFRKSNAKLLAISPQLPEQSREVISKHKLNFEILHDANNAYTQKLDIVHGFPDDLKQLYLDSFGIDLEAANGENSWTLAMPARIVVDSEHRVKSIDVNSSYTVRPEPDETLAIVMS